MSRIRAEGIHYLLSLTIQQTSHVGRCLLHVLLQLSSHLLEGLGRHTQLSQHRTHLSQCRLQRVAQSRQGSCEVGTQI